MSPDFERAGYALFAVSYDPVEVLGAFSDKHGITYDLLSDRGSEVIRRLGLINLHIEQQQTFYGFKVTERHRGLPYPGTFLLDESGAVVAKDFEQSYRDRPSGAYLLEEAGLSDAPPVYEAQAMDEGITITAWVSRRTYRPMQKSVLHVRADIADGFHAYTEPVPESYTPLTVAVEPADGLMVWPADMPRGRAFTVAGIDEQFHVLEGSVEFSIPFKISGTKNLADGRSRATPLEDDSVALTLVVNYQLCTATWCQPPGERRLSVTLSEEGLVT